MCYCLFLCLSWGCFPISLRVSMSLQTKGTTIAGSGTATIQGALYVNDSSTCSTASSLAANAWLTVNDGATFTVNAAHTAAAGAHHVVHHGLPLALFFSLCPCACLILFTVAGHLVFNAVASLASSVDVQAQATMTIGASAANSAISGAVTVEGNVRLFVLVRVFVFGC